jgi:excisionase family DNA binding protein
MGGSAARLKRPISPAPRVPGGWVSITQYAHTYGISRSTVYKWLDAHLLITYRKGRVLRIKDAPPDQHGP